MTLQHEKKVTGLIHRLAYIAERVKDKDARSFLNWFIKEQVEEEETAEKILISFGVGKVSQALLRRIDSKLARRR